MALIVGDATVATGMSLVVEGALYADEVFIDELTYTSKYDVGNAGQIQVEKYSPSHVTPTTPGSNFQDENYSNNVVNINCNNSFQKSTKVPAYYRATMPSDLFANKTWDTTEAVRVGRQMSGLAVLLTEAGITSTQASKATAENVKARILADRARMRKGHAHPDVVLCSVDCYSAILEAAGKDFTPGINDEVVRMGRVGYWLGMLFVECSYLADVVNLSYIDADGITQPVTVGGDYIMYDHRAFSIIDKLTMLRVIDSEQFAGSKVQEELDVGFKVTNEDCVLVSQVSVETYDVTVTNDGHGTASASPTSAPAGAEITLTATPSEGYEFDAWVVSPDTVEITNNKFTMPASDVSVQATFKQTL